MPDTSTVSFSSILFFLIYPSQNKILIFSFINPFPNDKCKTLPNWYSLQTTIVNFKKNGSEFPKWVENTVGKGEIARYEQFLLFPLCFQKTSDT